MKKYFILSILCLLLLTGCGETTKETIDASNVPIVLTNHFVSYTDAKEKVGYADVAYYGEKSDAKINFIKGTKKYDIQGIFLDECKNAYSHIGEKYKKKIDGGKNWESLLLTTDEKFVYVAWVEDSYISIEGPIKYKKDLINMAEEMGF